MGRVCGVWRVRLAFSGDGRKRYVNSGQVSMQTLAAGLFLILWGMRDYAHADGNGNGNHGNLGASGQQPKTGGRRIHPLQASAV